MSSPKPFILIILDGWGCRVEKADNGIAQAKKPHFDRLWEAYPHTLIKASGPAVGLPEGIMGNSEVGHMNLGAGRIVFTGLSQVYRAIEDGSFFTNPSLLLATHAARKNKSTLHLMGLLSDGAVHSHQDHLYALLDLAAREKVSDVAIHCFMDGRDTPPRDGIKYIHKLEEVIQEKGVGRIASVSGRYYAMDRDKRWDRVERAYHALTCSNSPHPPLKLRGGERGSYKRAEEIILESYNKGITDEFIVPQAILNERGLPQGPIQDGDAVIFFNFRADRAREITRALTDPEFRDFPRAPWPLLSEYVCMSVYDETFNLPVAFSPHYPQNTFGETLSRHGLKQLRIAETEKYAHVTFFFSGGREKPLPGEERVLVPSPREVPTYDQKPEMSAQPITREVLKEIDSGRFDVIVMNFANSDMVGHTAKPAAIIRAIEAVDECLGKITDCALKKGGAVAVTADHGNAEQMVDEKGEPHTAHTLNPVPFIVISNEGGKIRLKQDSGRLCDVAPTLLDLLKLEKPAEMTGESLIKR